MNILIKFYGDWMDNLNSQKTSLHLYHNVNVIGKAADVFFVVFLLFLL